MPWSVPILFLSSASKTSLAKVRMSPPLSPAAPVSVTVSVAACSIIFSSCGAVAAGPAAMRPPAATITGGTGEYAGVLGEMALSARGSDGKAYNFTYRIK
jgi:hypothetical protein